MNNYGTRTTQEEKLAFPYEEYPLIYFTGIFNVTLVDKTWAPSYNGQYLICAFQTDDNIKFRFNVWRTPKIEIYMPRKSKIDFAKVLPGTRWKCEFIRTKNGNINWRSAEPIND